MQTVVGECGDAPKAEPSGRAGQRVQPRHVRAWLGLGLGLLGLGLGVGVGVGVGVGIGVGL